MEPAISFLQLMIPLLPGLTVILTKLRELPAHITLEPPWIRAWRIWTHVSVGFAEIGPAQTESCNYGALPRVETVSSCDRLAGAAGGTMDTCTGRSVREYMVLTLAIHGVLSARSCKVRTRVEPACRAVEPRCLPIAVIAILVLYCGSSELGQTLTVKEVPLQ